MRKPGGKFIITDTFGCVEIDTFTCGHCNSIVPVPPKERPEDLGGNCNICWKLVCPGCVEKGTCDPFEEKLKRMEDKARTLQSYGI